MLLFEIFQRSCWLLKLDKWKLLFVELVAPSSRLIPCQSHSCRSPFPGFQSQPQTWPSLSSCQAWLAVKPSWFFRWAGSVKANLMLNCTRFPRSCGTDGCSFNDAIALCPSNDLAIKHPNWWSKLMSSIVVIFFLRQKKALAITEKLR